ncbi:hypothetical protein F5883DRAFT_215177 [Diaporthe sp. PMI_573]|nr:hypothetical protein F5883DRAFT_215177 [Diaporthaceae sp. PMI_573]
MSMGLLCLVYWCGFSAQTSRRCLGELLLAVSGTTDDPIRACYRIPVCSCGCPLSQTLRLYFGYPADPVSAPDHTRTSASC